jgi:hypothetical protein
VLLFLQLCNCFSAVYSVAAAPIERIAAALGDSKSNTEILF